MLCIQDFTSTGASWPTVQVGKEECPPGKGSAVAHILPPAVERVSLLTQPKRTATCWFFIHWYLPIEILQFLFLLLRTNMTMLKLTDYTKSLTLPPKQSKTRFLFSVEKNRKKLKRNLNFSFQHGRLRPECCSTAWHLGKERNAAEWIGERHC